MELTCALPVFVKTPTLSAAYTLDQVENSPAASGIGISGW